MLIAAKIRFCDAVAKQFAPEIILSGLMRVLAAHNDPAWICWSSCS